MPFNPTLPVDGALISAAELRDQFNGLSDLISTIPVGPVGPMGPQGDPGPPFAAAQVDITNTSPAGSSAAVSVWFDGVNVHFNFDIPQGMPGEVSAATLTNEINNLLGNSSNSSNGVAELLPSQPNPTLLEVAQKLDELILALRR